MPAEEVYADDDSDADVDERGGRRADMGDVDNQDDSDSDDEVDIPKLKWQTGI